MDNLAASSCPNLERESTGQLVTYAIPFGLICPTHPPYAPGDPTPPHDTNHRPTHKWSVHQRPAERSEHTASPAESDQGASPRTATSGSVAERYSQADWWNNVPEYIQSSPTSPPPRTHYAGNYSNGDTKSNATHLPYNELLTKSGPSNQAHSEPEPTGPTTLSLLGQSSFYIDQGSTD